MNKRIAEALVECDSSLCLTGNEDRRNGRLFLEVECECGTVKYVRADNLKQRGGMKSCGCKRKEKFTTEKHGMNKRHNRHSLYSIWDSMHQRCYNDKNKSFKYYGGKGVKVCEEWRNILGFTNWALNSGFITGLTIDRIDSNGNYEPSNCQWITRSENSKKAVKEMWRNANGTFKSTAA